MNHKPADKAEKKETEFHTKAFNEHIYRGWHNKQIDLLSPDDAVLLTSQPGIETALTQTDLQSSLTKLNDAEKEHIQQQIALNERELKYQKKLEAHNQKIGKHNFISENIEVLNYFIQNPKHTFDMNMPDFGERQISQLRDYMKDYGQAKNKEDFLDDKRSALKEMEPLKAQVEKELPTKQEMESTEKKLEEIKKERKKIDEQSKKDSQLGYLQTCSRCIKEAEKSVIKKIEGIYVDHVNAKWKPDFLRRRGAADEVFPQGADLKTVINNLIAHAKKNNTGASAKTIAQLVNSNVITSEFLKERNCPDTLLPSQSAQAAKHN